MVTKGLIITKVKSSIIRGLIALSTTNFDRVSCGSKKLSDLVNAFVVHCDRCKDGSFFFLLQDRVFWGNAALNGLVIKKVGEIEVSVKRVADKTKNSEDRGPI